MLHPKSNRIDYGEQLVPPEGYKLDRAIGTTYSLDLEALMILPVALFYSQSLDGDPSDLRYDMLDAITRSAEKITVYCQKGQVKVPQKYHYLLAYWEKAVVPVQMPSHVQSFHPKVWIIRYTKENEPPIYRLLVTSRNLTFARDWDLAFSSEGKVGDSDIKFNQPLVDFLHELAKAGGDIPGHIYVELLKVKFDTDLGYFNRLRFHPIGVTNDLGKKYGQPCAASKWWDELLIISPFVDNTTLKAFAGITGKKPALLSRKEELDAISPDLIEKFQCFQFSRLIEEAELDENVNEMESGASLQSLHAKLFVSQVEDKVHWFLGSANCTNPAQGRNIEFLVELRGDVQNGFRPRDLLKQLTRPERENEGVLFEPYDPTKRADVSLKKELDNQLRKIKFDLSEMLITGEAIKLENATSYDLNITIDAGSIKLPEGFSVHYRPLTAETETVAEMKPGIININSDFKGYAETRLSPFIEFQIWHQRTKYTCFLLNMEIKLPDTRFNKIFSSIINSREKFLKYLSFLLTGEETTLIESGTDDRKPGSAANGGGYFEQFPVYEKLLVAASRYPEKLVSVDKLMERLRSETGEGQETIISKEFEEFWQIFREYQQNTVHAG